jgi:hypothetical protein
MATPRSLAHRLHQSFLANGNFPLAGAAISLPAAESDEAEQFADLGAFAGLQVHSVGFDEDTDPAVYIYLVKGAAKEIKRLPREQDGVRIKVRPVGAMSVRPQSSAKQPPKLFLRDGRIACGSSCAPTGVTYSGTMGALVKDDKKLYCLSNNHILGDCNHMPVGMPVMAPSSADGKPNLSPPLAIAKFSRLIAMTSANPSHVKPSKLDVAIAEITYKDRVTSWQGDEFDGYDTPTTVVSPSAGMAVRKFGRTTGLTVGTIEARILQPMAVPYVSNHFRATVWFADVWAVRATSEHFALAGDSGSLVVSNDGTEAVGLLFAANPSGIYGWFMPLEGVFANSNFKGLSLVTGHHT